MGINRRFRPQCQQRRRRPYQQRSARSLFWKGIRAPAESSIRVKIRELTSQAAHKRSGGSEGRSGGGAYQFSMACSQEYMPVYGCLLVEWGVQRVLVSLCQSNARGGRILSNRQVFSLSTSSSSFLFLSPSKCYASSRSFLHSFMARSLLFQRNCIRYIRCWSTPSCRRI
jgi:hypothetical protein